MTDYLVKSPDGKQYRVTAPEGTSQEDLFDYVQSQNGGAREGTHAMPAPPAAPTPGFAPGFAPGHGPGFPLPTSPPDTSTDEPAGLGLAMKAAGAISPLGGVVGMLGENATNFMEGGAQGAVFDPVEAVGQIFEHATNSRIPIPQSVRNWFDQYRRHVQSTKMGTVGEIAGTVAPMAIPGLGEADLAAMAGRAGVMSLKAARAGAVGDVRLARALTPTHPTTKLAQMAWSKTPETVKAAARGAGAAELQPVASDQQGADFWKAKGWQAAGGAALPAGVVNPVSRKLVSLAGYPVAHAAGATAAHMLPGGYGVWYGLHHLARGAHHLADKGLTKAASKTGPRTQRTMGAIMGHRSAAPPFLRDARGDVYPYQEDDR